MSFDTTTITEVMPPSREGGRLVLEWTSSAAAGTYFQVYVEGNLAWYGTDRHTLVSAPAGMIDIHVGTVADGEQTTDFSSSLTPIATRAFLSWQAGGAAGFHIYSGSLPGGAVSYATPVADVTAIEHGLSTDGYDLGGYDLAGYDGGGSFSWTSQPLAAGTWNFGVKSYDEAGNEGAAVTTSVAIACPPRPPATDGAGKRLEYSYNATTHKVSLSWLPSPG